MIGSRPEGLLAVPLVSTQEAVSALASIIVGLLQANLGVLDIGKWNAKDQNRPCITVSKV